MVNRKKENERKENVNGDHIEVDFGMGKIAFGGLFKGLGSLIDLAGKLDDQGTNKTGEIKGLPKGARGIYGFSIRTLGGKPVIETFGNVKESVRGPVVEETWEPIVDVYEEKDLILVVCELPGVSEDKIKIEICGDILNLSAASRKRKYAKEILLPCKVKSSPVKKSYRNGLLEITLDKES